MADNDQQPIVPMDDDVTSFPADQARLQTFRDASAQLSRFQVPRLLDAANPREKLFYAFFDGTGNDAEKDPLHATNVGRLRDRIIDLKKTDAQVDFHYVAGVGTQDQALARALDGALGYTYETRLEEMYEKLVDKAWEWDQAEPGVKISVCSVGFSRGGTQCAIFTNLLDQRGIVDPTSRVEDAEGRISYTRHIAPPGQTPQSVALFDPVSTGVQELADRRLAPSVVSGFQITALDEQRVKFISDRVMPLGLSEDGRFLNVAVAGAHSDIGGSYLRDGLSNRSLNLTVDFLNAQRPGAPMFEKVHEPDDPRLNRVHNSHEGMPIYQLDRKVSRSMPEGVNTRLAPELPVAAGQVAMPESVPHGPKPLARELAREAMTQVRIGPVPDRPGERAVANLERIAAAEAAGIGPLTGEQKLANLARGVAGGAGVALGVGATAYDGVQTARRVSELMEQGNHTAAQSEINHAWARNAGGWVGGAAATYAMGASGFVPAAIVAGDALLMSKAFEHGSDLVDNHKVFRQTDKAGVDWQFTGREWTREGQLDRGNGDGDDAAIDSSFGASYEKSRELNAHANAAAVELALGKVPAPQDPFSVPASDGERRLDNPDWRYDARSDQWSRSVKVALTGVNDTGVYQTQIALPERKVELDRQALGIIQHNIANSREAIAQSYLENAAAQRTQDFIGVPAAVEAARAKPDTVTGSDNRLYRREQAEQTVQWVRKDTGEAAEGNRALELELTWQVRQPVLEQAQQTLAQLQARPAPTPAQVEQNELLHRYRVAGTELNPDFQQAIELASQRTRQAHGITGQGSVKLLRNETGQFGADSPIAHYQRGTDGVDHLVATTTTQEIRQALAEVRQQHVETATATLATVSVVAPSTGHGQSTRPPALTRGEATPPDTPTPPANVPGPAMSDTAGQPGPALPQEPQPAPPHSQEQATPAPMPARSASFTDPGHAGHATYQRILREVHYMEAGQGIAPGPHSEKIAAALLNESVAKGLHISQVRMGADGNVRGIQQLSAFDTPREVSIVPRQAQGLSMQEYAVRLESTLSSHLAGKAPAAAREPAQAHAISAMSMADQVMFAHLRRGTPGHIGDDQVAQSMLAAKRSGIDDASKIGGMTMAGDRLWIIGTGEGQRVAIDVSRQAPPVQDTLQQLQVVNQQREQQLAMDQQRSQQAPGRGAPVMG
ncbi:T6SS phospholipase effector Tle1-like catalytic domain-containing protein [Pseudoxanthomonas spadix]|uniref:T6SS phospholipase effector Tle1-like catalytic domain-containing protein n=1 Tax=Pseudoxanthomonas spadix TaxID=415229 RepID=UPI000EFF3DCF|nr:DUF2235 domain-containing protein [Pseudoxanthomonas spadix]MBP3974185.1 DUF2235 domain-containing protein [Pseudoxanthomonas spadix]RMW96386.1 hypothetical protein D9R12_05720 [Pseudoxanthomonas spadix]